jgi:hypothetical protein
MAAAATTRFTGAFLHLDSLAFHLQRGAPHSSADVMEGHTERRVPPRLRRDFAFDRRVFGIVDCGLWIVDYGMTSLCNMPIKK